MVERRLGELSRVPLNNILDSFFPETDCMPAARTGIDLLSGRQLLMSIGCRAYLTTNARISPLKLSRFLYTILN